MLVALTSTSMVIFKLILVILVTYTVMLVMIIMTSNTVKSYRK
jgi:hypothetical protein